MSDSQALANKLADAELDFEQGRRAQGLRKLREVRDELRTGPGKPGITITRPLPDNGYLPSIYPLRPGYHPMPIRGRLGDLDAISVER